MRIAANNPRISAFLAEGVSEFASSPPLAAFRHRQSFQLVASFKLSPSIAIFRQNPRI
jgi:hypothetical protein